MYCDVSKETVCTVGVSREAEAPAVVASVAAPVVAFRKRRWLVELFMNRFLP